MSEVLCASMIRKKEEWRKEKSCVVTALAKQKEFSDYTFKQTKRNCGLYLQPNENLILYIILNYFN